MSTSEKDSLTCYIKILTIEIICQKYVSFIWGAKCVIKHLDLKI